MHLETLLTVKLVLVTADVATSDGKANASNKGLKGPASMGGVTVSNRVTTYMTLL